MTLAFTRSKLAKIAQSVFDQAWLSGINFLISLVLIRELDKTDYGLYVLLLNTVLLFQGINGALLTAPFTTLLPQKTAATQPAVLQVYGALTGVYGGVSALAGFAALWGYHAWSGDPALSPWVCAGFGLCIFGSIYRDNIRAFHYALGQAGHALHNNLIYGCVLLVALGSSWWQHWLSTANVMAIIGVTGALISTSLLRTAWSPAVRHWDAWQPQQPARRSAEEFWTCGRWALLGAVMTFAASNTHPYFAALNFTKSEVADLAASRLLTVPIALIGTAWSNMARPLISKWQHEGQHGKLQHIIRQSLLLACGLTVVTMLLLMLLSDSIPKLLGQKYQNLLPMTLIWTFYTGATFIKSIYGATLMTNDQGYKLLSKVASVNLLAMVVVMALASVSGWPEAIIVALTLLEFLQIYLMIYFRRRFLPDFTSVQNSVTTDTQDGPESHHVQL